MSSLVGALFGAFYLAFTIPIVRPLVLAFGSPEMFMLVILGLTCIATLSGHGKRGLLLGMMSGGFGLLCSLIGQDRQAGILRFTFGQLYLWNGLSIIPVMIGLFAIPEIVDLAVRGTAIAGNVTYGKLGKGVMEGIKDTFRHFWLTVRCSLIGSLIGTLPGLGGGVAQWVAYAHATQSAKTEEERAGFGKGDIRGVLGPGAANNSKEGAGLIPTVARTCFPNISP
jgi:TctA family transporter